MPFPVIYDIPFLCLIEKLTEKTTNLKICYNSIKKSKREQHESIMGARRVTVMKKEGEEVYQ